MIITIIKSDNNNDNSNKIELQKEQHGKERKVDLKKKLVHQMRIEASFIVDSKHYTEKKKKS